MSGVTGAHTTLDLHLEASNPPSAAALSLRGLPDPAGRGRGPTRRGAGPSVPLGPWQLLQRRATNVAAPSPALPLPGGSSKPSGPAVRSDGRSSSGDAGRPSL